jgi:hypothetical protein
VLGEKLSHVDPASCLSFLILQGRTKIRLQPLLLELYPSSSDELMKGSILGAALSAYTPRAFRFDKIESPGA